MDRLYSFLFDVGGRICHQRPERSLHFFGHQLPLCARCTGIYGALFVTLLFLAVVFRMSHARYPGRWYVAYIVLGIAAVALDGGTVWLGWRNSNMALRLITGALAGSAVALLFYPAFVSLLLERRERRTRGDKGKTRARGQR